MTSCRILNIHGYGGSPENCARNALCGLGQTVVSPAIDSHAEGLVLGVGAKIFTVAGPVLLYGTLAGFLYGVIYRVILFF